MLQPHLLDTDNELFEQQFKQFVEKDLSCTSTAYRPKISKEEIAKRLAEAHLLIWQALG